MISFEYPVMLVGANGMLGRAWRQELERSGIAYTAPSRECFNICDPEQIHREIDGQLSAVINCAGWTDVDGAEADPAGAMALNASAPGNLALACDHAGIPFVHYSTDYVFDGEVGSPYLPDDPRGPVNAYGRSKAIGENLVRMNSAHHLIIRSSWLYAPWGKNFLRTMADIMRTNPKVRVVEDQIGRPTSAEWLAQASLRLLMTDKRGIWHVTDDGQCSWHRFALAIRDALNLPCEVEPCASSTYPRPASRPEWSVLDISRTTEAIGQAPHWEDSVRDAARRATSDARIAA